MHKVVMGKSSKNKHSVIDMLAEIASSPSQFFINDV